MAAPAASDISAKALFLIFTEFPFPRRASAARHSNAEQLHSGAAGTSARRRIAEAGQAPTIGGRGAV